MTHHFPILLMQCVSLALAARSIEDVRMIEFVATSQASTGRCVDDVRLEAWNPSDALSGSSSPAQETWQKEFATAWQPRIDERMREHKATSQKEHPKMGFNAYMKAFHKAEWNAWALLEEMEWRVDGSDADGVSEDLRVVSLIKEGHMVATAFVGYDKEQEALTIIGIISGGSIHLPTAVKNTGRTLIRMMVDYFKPKILKGEPADEWLAKQYQMMGLEKSSANLKMMHLNIEPTCLAFYSRILCGDATGEDCKSVACWSTLFGKNADIAKTLSCKQHQNLLDTAMGAAKGVLKSIFQKDTTD